jgi:mannosyltransferase
MTAPSRGNAAYALGGVVVGAVLMLMPGAPSLWLDETVSISIARLDWGSLWSIMSAREGNGGLYYVVLHVWQTVGDSETWLRALSIVAALATIVVTYLLARRLFDRTVAGAAALLLAINGLFLTEATEIRGYALTTLLVTVSCLLLVRAIQERSGASFVAYAIVAALALYGHLFSVFVIAGQLASLLWLEKGRVVRRQVLPAAAVLVLLAIPIGVFAVTNGGQIGWIGRPTLEKIVGTGLVVAGGLAGGRATTSLDRLLGGVLVLFYAGGLALAVRHAVSLRRERSDRWPYVFLGCVTALPIATALVVSLLVQPVFYYKYFTLIVPVLVILVAAGLVKLSSARSAIVAVAALCLVGDVAIGKCYGDCNREDWKGAGAYVLERATFEDGAVLYAPEIRTAYDYYVPNGPQVPEVVYPPFPYVSPRYESADRPDRALVTRMAETYDRVWLVLSHVDAGSPGGHLAAWFEEEMGSPEQRSFKNVRVLLFSTL